MWQFDIGSALIGAGVALLLAGLAYYFRETLHSGWEAIAAPSIQLYHRLEADAEERYRELVTTWARSLIVPAHVVSLDAVFIEPELLAPPPVPQSLSDMESLSTDPQVLPLHRALGGHAQLAILGASGAGKTTLLAYVALACAGAKVKDKVEVEVEDEDEDEVTLETVQERLPLYVSLSAMDWHEASGEGGQEEEEGEGEKGRGGARDGGGVDRLIGAAVATVKGNKGMVSTLRQYLEAGRAVVLADGWDELSPQQRQPAATWLSELVGAMPGNLWLVGAGTRGYAPLTEAGFVPLKLAEWDARQVERFANQWGAAYAASGLAGDEEPPADLRQLVETLQQATRAGAAPFELALRAFVYLSDGQAPARRAPLFDRALDLLLRQEADPWLPAACRVTLGQVALSLQQEEWATASREEIDAVIESALPPAEEIPAHAANRVFRALTGEQGLLRPADSNRYAFTHPLWRAYLAARQMVAVAPESIIERLDDPSWAEALRFYAEVGDMKPLVAAWLRGADDIFHVRLRTLSSWVSVAPEDASWHNGAMAVLARGFLQSGCPARVRQALAEVLATTGTSGVTYLFKQALRHPDAGVRVAAVLGLARTAGESDLPALEAALRDESLAVREATVRGLAYLGIDAGRSWLERILSAGDERLSLVAAEALAQYGEESADFLREAVESENAMVRRAAVLGLAQVGARDLLEKVVREDDQWIVRSAATAAVEELEKQEQVFGVEPPPEIEQLPWLISWAAAQGEGVGLGEAAREMIRRALNEGDAPTRTAAARVLAQVGRLDDVELLRAALTATDPDATGAALEALAEISERYELRIE